MFILQGTSPSTSLISIVNILAGRALPGNVTVVLVYTVAIGIARGRAGGG